MGYPKDYIELNDNGLKAVVHKEEYKQMEEFCKDLKNQNKQTMEKQKEELVWIDGIFLTERPKITGTPSLGRVIIQTPDEETMRKKSSGGVILNTKDYAVGDKLYSRVVAAHPDEPGYKVGDYVLVTASGTPVKFDNVFCEIVQVHVILHKLN